MDYPSSEQFSQMGEACDMTFEEDFEPEEAEEAGAAPGRSKTGSARGLPCRFIQLSF